MFQMNEVGKKIAARRKEKNMTQMELADLMGVTFQAVSNWERGNSMPDISKLPELAEWLDISLDSLLTGGKPAALVKHILSGNEHVYIREEAVEPETVAQIAPILKPQQTETLLEDVLNQHAEKVSWQDLLDIAPFVSDAFLSEWALKAVSVSNIRNLASLAPFLSDETLDAVVARLAEADVPLNSLGELSSFLSEKALAMLVRRAFGDARFHQDLLTLAPFASERTIVDVLFSLEAPPALSPAMLSALAPYLSEQSLTRLVEGNLAAYAPDTAAPLAPFLSKQALTLLADSLIARFGVKGIKEIAAFL